MGQFCIWRVFPDDGLDPHVDVVRHLARDPDPHVPGVLHVQHYQPGRHPGGEERLAAGRAAWPLRVQGVPYKG